MLARLLILVDHADDGLRDQFVAISVRMPAVSLKGKAAKRLNGPIDCRTRRERDHEVTQFGNVNAFPFTFPATVCVHVEESRARLERCLVRPYPVAGSLIAVDAIIPKRDRVGHVVPEARMVP